MKFEDLEAWKEARSTVREIYVLTRHEPLASDFGLTRQVQRSAVSAMSNIAEGFERSGSAEKLNFYNIARASAGETRSLLYVVEDSYPEFEETCRDLRNKSIGVGRKITGLINSYRKRTTNK